jgi:hypothetical protein
MGLSGLRQAAVVAAAIMLLVALPAVLLLEIGQSRRLVDQARLSSVDWQRKYEASQQAARNLEKEAQAREQELEAQLKQERQAREAAEAGRLPDKRAVGELALLQTAAPIFDLTSVRSGRTVPAQISIPRSAQWIVLKLEIEPDPERQSYRATLLTSDQQVICRASDLMAVKGTLAISCKSDLFKSGDYRLSLEGLIQQGRYVSAGTYSFHVIKP